MDNPNDTGPQTPPGPQTLEAGKIVLKDAAGRVGARLGMGPAGPRLVLYGESGKPRAALSVVGEKPGLLLEDASDKVRVALGVGDNEPYFVLEDASGKTCAMLGFADNGPFLGLRDASGTPRAVLGFGNNNEPCLYFYDAKGKPRAFLGLEFDEPLLHLSDATGKRVARLGDARAESFLGYAALVCWAALLLLAPAIVRAQPGDPMGLLGGALALVGILLTAFWVRYRRLWWKTKGRAMTSYVADYEARDHERREAEHARHDADGR